MLSPPKKGKLQIVLEGWEELDITDPDVKELGATDLDVKENICQKCKKSSGDKEAPLGDDGCRVYSKPKDYPDSDHASKFDKKHPEYSWFSPGWGSGYDVDSEEFGIPNLKLGKYCYDCLDLEIDMARKRGTLVISDLSGIYSGMGSYDNFRDKKEEIANLRPEDPADWWKKGEVDDDD